MSSRPASWDIRRHPPEIQREVSELLRLVQTTPTHIDSPKYGRLLALPINLQEVPYSDLFNFVSLYPTHFPAFVDGECRHHASRLGGIPTDGNGGRGLRKGMNPLLAFSGRLARALRQAKDAAERAREEAEALASVLSQECAIPASPPRAVGDREAKGADAVVDEDMDMDMEQGELSDEYFDAPSPSRGGDVSSRNPRYTPTSPPKRHRDAEPVVPGSLLKKLRDAAPQSRPAETKSVPARPLRPQLTTSSESSAFTSTTTSSAVLSTSDIATNSTDITSFDSPSDAAPPTQPLPIPTRWEPLPALPKEEKIVYVTPPNPYQAMMNKQDVRHDTQVLLQSLMDRSRTRGHPIAWTDVLVKDLEGLTGPMADAGPAVQAVFRKIVKRKQKSTGPSPLGGPGENEEDEDEDERQPTAERGERDMRMFKEMDREESSIRTNDLRRIGNDSVDWPYGGGISYTILVTPEARITEHCVSLSPALPSFSPSERSKTNQTRSAPAGRVVPTSRNGPTDPPNNILGPSAAESSANGPPAQLPYTMSLIPPEMTGRSFRLARRFGSRRIITFKLNLQGSAARKCRVTPMELFRGRVFVVLGRTYRALWSPPDRDNVFAVETGDQPEMPSFEELLAMFNDLQQKPSQPLAKWAARPQILFSDSVPAATVDPSAICVVNDIVTSAASKLGHASTEQILTDGCGLMSESLAQRIYRHPALRFDSGRPCVIQIRLGGAKGLLMLMSQEQHRLHAGKEVVLRDSMVKALSKPAHASDPSLFQVDVVRCESLRIGTYLSSEPMMAMSHNGVPHSAFLNLRMQSLDEIRNAFLPRPHSDEEPEEVTNRLVASCYRQGGVGAERRKREAAVKGRSAKVLGLRRTSEDPDLAKEDEQGDEMIESWERFAVDPVSGQPGSIAEATMEAIAARFNPLESQHTGNKLHHLVKTLLNADVRNLRIHVENSLSAFVVPDPLGVLAPDEIFIRFASSAPIDPETKCPLTHLEGDVLAFRSPCKLPTDVRKFRAVYKPELSHLTDCVVMSAHSGLCERSPASILGGGDYDGDTVQLFWDKELVEPFRNADVGIADMPAGFENDYLDKEVVSGWEFLRQMGGRSEETRIANYQQFLLGALMDDKATGLYSRLHGNAVYELGYGHPETIILGRIFGLVLDARKSGLRIKPAVKKAHQQERDGYRRWYAHKKGEEENGRRQLTRPRNLGNFIMDQILDRGLEQAEAIGADFPSEVQRPSLADYEALVSPWKSAWDLLETMGPRDNPSTAIDQKPQMQAHAVYDKLMDELHQIQRHVEACMDVWDLGRQSRIGPRDRVVDLYRKYYKDRLSLPQTPRKTPRSKASLPTPSRHEAPEGQAGLVLSSKMRQLAWVWREELRVEDVALVCMGDENKLRRLMVGCAAELAKRKATQLFPFDVDFEIALELRAKAGGGSLTLAADVQRSMKPAYKAESAAAGRRT